MPDFKPKIITDPELHLVIPMPRPGLGTLRVDGHLLRVRHCPTCKLHSTIQVCPLCGTPTETSTPNEESLHRDDAPTLRRGRRPAAVRIEERSGRPAAITEGDSE